MIHKGTVTLITERLILRRFVIDDAETMFNNWANDPEVTRFLSWEPHGDVEVTKTLLQFWVEDYKNSNCYNWAIVYDNNLIGTISLLNPKDDIAEAEAGYCMAKKYWGKGIMAEALTAVIKYSFDEIGFSRIVAKHNVDNPNSGKVMIKSGMKYLETKNAPLALNPDKIVMCDFYEIYNLSFIK